MGATKGAPRVGAFLYFMAMGLAGMYLTYAAVQGDHGLFRRIEVEAEAGRYRAELDGVVAIQARYTELTRRMSDDYLDLDLLDERVRDVLGFVAAGEVVLR